VLLIGGLGDTVESWQFQLEGLRDRYRVTAFDNRGAGRTGMSEGRLSAEAMADDAAALMRALELPTAHVAGFSMEARSHRSWRSATPSSCAASSSSARTLDRTRCSAPS
jgi:pimeloyl-ACP methyl ester carboxylesterase